MSAEPAMKLPCLQADCMYAIVDAVMFTNWLYTMLDAVMLHVPAATFELLESLTYKHPIIRLLQSNLSIPDTLGPSKTVHIIEVSLFQRFSYTHLYCSGTTVNFPYFRVSTIAGLSIDATSSNVSLTSYAVSK